MNRAKQLAAILIAALVSLATGLTFAIDQTDPGAGNTTAIVQKSDAERIVGVWRITKGETEGRDFPAEIISLGRMTFTKDGVARFNVGAEIEEKGSYKLVAAGQIDLALGRGGASPGIYRFDGDDRLTICIGNLTMKRPTEYTSTKGTGQTQLVFQRAKPGEEKPSPEEIAKLKGSIDKLQEAAIRTHSSNNLKQIALAMHGYHDANRAFPLHAIYSKDGKTPLLSWRVAILPFVDEIDLYKEFKFDEPWDSAHNKKLIAKMPKVYESLGAAKKGEGLTYYQVFTGPDTLFDGAKKIKINQINDGTSNTLLAIEAKEPVVWTKPADLQLPKEKDKMPAVGGVLKSGFNTVLCDGIVRFMPHDTPPAKLRALVTPNGND